MCSVSLRRSAPAIGTSRGLERAVDGVGLRAARCATGSGCRRAGSARRSLRAARSRSSQPATVVGDAVGELHLRALLAEMVERARPVLRLDLRRRLDHRPDDDPAGLVAPRARCGSSGRGSAARPRCAVSEAKTASTASSTTGDRAEGEVELEVAPGEAGARGRGRRARAACARTTPARRPGRRRSTASRRRRRRACGPSSLAPSPAKNSSASARITCHWRGLVSCASSTRMWSRPRSSL